MSDQPKLVVKSAHIRLLRSCDEIVFIVTFKTIPKISASYTLQLQFNESSPVVKYEKKSMTFSSSLTEVEMTIPRTSCGDGDTLSGVCVKPVQ